MSSVTPYIAGYAAIVSTTVAARQILRERPRFKIVDGPERVFDETTNTIGWRVAVVNVSARPVAFEQRRCWLFGDDDDELHGSITGVDDTGLLGLGPGETRSLFFQLPYDGVVAAVLTDSFGTQKIRCVDGTDRTERKRIARAVDRPLSSTWY